MSGDGGEQFGVGGEVPARGAVRDPGLAGDLAQGEGVDALQREQFDPGRDQAGAQADGLVLFGHGDVSIKIE